MKVYESKIQSILNDDPRNEINVNEMKEYLNQIAKKYLIDNQIDFDIYIPKCTLFNKADCLYKVIDLKNNLEINIDKYLKKYPNAVELPSIEKIYTHIEQKDGLLFIFHYQIANHYSYRFSLDLMLQKKLNILLCYEFIAISPNGNAVKYYLKWDKISKNKLVFHYNISSEYLKRHFENLYFQRYGICIMPTDYDKSSDEVFQKVVFPFFSNIFINDVFYSNILNFDNLLKYIDSTYMPINGKEHHKLYELQIQTIPQIKEILGKDEETLTHIDYIGNSSFVIRFFIKIEIDSEIFAYEKYQLIWNENKFYKLENADKSGYIIRNMSLVKYLEKWNIKKSDFPQDVIDNTSLKYIFKDNIIGDNENPIKKIIMLLSSVQLESIYKIGLNIYATRIVNFATYKNIKIDNAIKIVFGETKQDTNKILSYLGINQHMIEKLKESEYNDNSIITPKKDLSIIKVIKLILDKNDISSIDDDSFDTLFDYLMNMDLSFGDYVDSIYYPSFSKHICFLIKMIDYTEGNIKLAVNIIKLLNTESIISDAIHIMSLAISLKNENKYHGNPFKGIYSLKEEDIPDFLTRTYNNFIIITNMFNGKYNRYYKNFNFLQEKWEQYKYENENFIIITPQKPEDLILEGIKLSHCVKSYIEEVAEGNTNIFFIRKKNNFQEPFYTAEISKNNVLRQVHGFANENVPVGSDLEKFILEWQESKKFKLGDYNQALAVQR